MITTEGNAKTKWCPFSRVYDLGGSAINRYQDNKTPGSAMCIAGRCMAWEWVDEEGGVGSRGRCGLTK
jgi:hypothetical protein